ncbi:MAG: PAS domain-containing protein [Clostridiales bacterium]|jgi:transcriptional regulator with PAS, ATPase and Fis domain|nr:PAS domain-containing protein [Clostridiales bacterium]
MEEEVGRINYFLAFKKAYKMYSRLGAICIASAASVVLVGLLLSKLNVNPVVTLTSTVLLYSIISISAYEYILSKQKRDIKKISYYIEQISDGITSTEFSLKGFDGADAINHSLKKISDQINNISNEVESVNNNILNGNFELRVSESGQQGRFYDICFNANNFISSFNWVLDNMTVPLVVVNQKSTITYLNIQAAQLIKRPINRLMNKGFYTYFDLDDASFENNIVKHCFRTGEITNTKTKIYIENEARNLYYSVIPIKDDNHNITAVMICFIDYMSISGDEIYKKPEDVYFEKRMLRLINAVEEYSRYEPAAKNSYLNF